MASPKKKPSGVAALYTLAEAAEMIGCHRSQTSRWARRLGVGTPFAGRIIVTPAEIERLREAMATTPKGRPRKKQPPQ